MTKGWGEGGRISSTLEGDLWEEGIKVGRREGGGAWGRSAAEASEAKIWISSTLEGDMWPTWEGRGGDGGGRGVGEGGR